MEIKLSGKGKDEERTLMVEGHIPNEEEQEKARKAQVFLEDYLVVTIGKESIQVSGDELRRASIALCPEEANLMM